MRAGTPVVALSLGVVLFCCHVRGDEPPRAQDGVAERPPQFLARVRDRWVRRAQATAQPRRPAPAASPAAPAEVSVTPAAASPIQASTATPAASAPVASAPAQPNTLAPAQPNTAAPAQLNTAAPAQPQPGPAATATAAVEPAVSDQELLSGIGSGTDTQMIGDMSPFTTMQRVLAAQQQPTLPKPFPPGKLPRPPSPAVASSLAPSARGFKIGENQSPMPQDRVYFTFDYFNNLNGALNKRFEAPVDNVQAFRYIFGLEKTFDEGRGSIGMQLPLDTLTADSTIQGDFKRPGGTSTALNDLTVYTKYILKRNPVTGSLISAGLAVTPTTGPSTFAGANYVTAVHDTTVQPFIGYLWRRGDFFLHGFAAIDVPTSVRDVTMVYNDIGIGYYAYRDTDPDAFLTALVPTFEVHVNSPLTHGDYTNMLDVTGTPDVVNLTCGASALIGPNSVFTFGVVTPVTGPRPFTYEMLFLLNFRFGRSSGARAPLPIIGG